MAIKSGKIEAWMAQRLKWAVWVPFPCQSPCADHIWNCISEKPAKLRPSETHQCPWQDFLFSKITFGDCRFGFHESSQESVSVQSMQGHKSSICLWFRKGLLIFRKGLLIGRKCRWQTWLLHPPCGENVLWNGYRTASQCPLCDIIWSWRAPTVPALFCNRGRAHWP